MTPSASSGDWARRAARVGRCVARFRLATKPHVQAWRATRVATGGARCVGCGDLFQPHEPHVEVLAGADPAARDPVSADDQEDEA